MGYKIDRLNRGKGLASLMIAHMLDVVIPDLGIHRTECYIHPDNKISLHLMDKMSFIDEGIAHSYVKLNGNGRITDVLSISPDTSIQIWIRIIASMAFLKIVKAKH